MSAPDYREIKRSLKYIKKTVAESISVLEAMVVEQERRSKGCPICSGEKDCSNCYYYDEIYDDDHCIDCDLEFSNWMPLGDTYCRKCGKQLNKEDVI